MQKIKPSPAPTSRRKSQINDDYMKTLSNQRRKSRPAKTVTLIFSAAENGAELCRVDFPVRIIAAMKRGAKKLHLSLEQLVLLVIQNKIERELGPKIPRSGGAQ